MEEGAGRRQDAFGLREIGLNLSTTQGDAQSMMYTQDSTVDTVMQPIGVATSRDDPASKIGKRLQKNTRKVTRYFPGKAPKWVKSNEDDDVKAFGAPRRRRAAEPVVIAVGAVFGTPPLGVSASTRAEYLPSPTELRALTFR